MLYTTYILTHSSLFNEIYHSPGAGADCVTWLLRVRMTQSSNPSPTVMGACYHAPTPCRRPCADLRQKVTTSAHGNRVRMTESSNPSPTVMGACLHAPMRLHLAYHPVTVGHRSSDLWSLGPKVIGHRSSDQRWAHGRLGLLEYSGIIYY